MAGFHRILVPLDGSEFTERALEPALMIARAASAEVVLMRVAEPIPRTRELLKSPKLHHDFETAAYREAAAYLNTSDTVAVRGGVRPSSAGVRRNCRPDR